MYVFHPKENSKGLPKDDVFIVANSNEIPVAEGYIVCILRPLLFPDRPLNLFINIRSKGQGREMLLGALLARAQQYRDEMPQYKSRVYAQVPSENNEMLAFYAENCFDIHKDSLNIVSLNMPRVQYGLPAGFQLTAIPLANETDIRTLALRLNAYRLDGWKPRDIMQMMESQHFLALQLTNGNEIAGEIVFMGGGDSAKLMSMYVAPPYRRQGFAKLLVAAGYGELNKRGVTYLESDLIQRSYAQTMLANSCVATSVRVVYQYPGIDYDAILP